MAMIRGLIDQPEIMAWILRLKMGCVDGWPLRAPTYTG
jgi:hypothetical protein